MQLDETMNLMAQFTKFSRQYVNTTALLEILPQPKNHSPFHESLLRGSTFYVDEMTNFETKSSRLEISHTLSLGGPTECNNLVKCTQDHTYYT